ncbi:MAG: regulatory protein RecX [bacterium]|nr:regulatory protein RecX [bacterium]
MVRNRYPEKSVKRKKNSSPLAAALRFLSFRARSEQEMRLKLAQRYTSVEVDQTVARLKQLDLINDGDFARQYIESRSRSRPRSRKLLELELRRKGVKLDEEDQTPEINDLELATTALKKKPHLKSWEQAVRFLTSRGFSWTVIEKVVKNRYNDTDVS